MEAQRRDRSSQLQWDSLTALSKADLKWTQNVPEHQ